MKLLSAIIFVVLISTAGIVGLAYSGIPDVSATGEESAVVRWLLETTRRQTVEQRAAAINVPDLTGSSDIAAGAGAFDEMCAGCHGAPGREPFVGARDMSPQPPDLAKRAADRSPAELFWVIKHGIRMTGMPAWGPTHEDDELWEVVAFAKRLPELDAAGYRELVSRAGAGGHAHTHGDQGGAGGSAAQKGETASGTADHGHDDHGHQH